MFHITHQMHQMVLAKFWCGVLSFWLIYWNQQSYYKNSENAKKKKTGKTCSPECSLKHLVYNMVHLLHGKGLGSLVKGALFMSLSDQVVMWIEFFFLFIVLNFSCKISIPCPIFSSIQLQSTCTMELHSTKES